jgi:hypothetical protein
VDGQPRQHVLKFPYVSWPIVPLQLTFSCITKNLASSTKFLDLFAMVTVEFANEIAREMNNVLASIA